MKIFLLILLLTLSICTAFAGTKWEGKVPKVAEESKVWETLLDELIKNEMYYGALITAYRGLLYYDDLKIKQKAYKVIVSLIDKGYPDKILYMFVTGDIEPDEGYNYINSYNLYKAVVNEMKGMKKWADDFFSKIDKENFYKYLFYQAIQFYMADEYNQAIEQIQKILKLPLKDDQLPFIRKVTRTMARIYFKQEKYEKSLDIYENFLIKTNPVHPSDWVETAWNYYYLKKYQAGLGMLYNMGSKVVKPPYNLENYIIRALIYLDLCATEQVEKLIVSFEGTYDKAIKGIINGKPLRSQKDLLLVYSASNKSYFDMENISQNLITEYKKKLKLLPLDSRPLASYIYRSEFKMIKKKKSMYLEQVYNTSANQLIMTAESLKFLKFSVMREKFNPDTVFNTVKTQEYTKSYEDKGDDGFIITWKQRGDFWRDERTKFFGDISNQCVK